MEPARGPQYGSVAPSTARVRRVLTIQELEAVYRAEVAQVWSFLARLGATRSALEDLTHDVFVVAIRRLGEFDAARPARPWLFGIAYRVLLDFKRLAVHRVEVTGAPPERGAEGDAEARLEQRDASRLVQAALDALVPEQREVVVMHDLHELAIPEVAQIAGIPLGTAYSRLRLGRKHFVSAVRALQQEAGR